MTAQGGMDIEQVLAQVRPKTTTVRVCLRGDLLAAHEDAERALAEARRGDVLENKYAQAPDAARRVQEIEAELDEAATVFTFAAVGQKAWTDLLVQHKPSDEDRAQGYEFDPQTFPQTAIAASAVDPKMNPTQAQRLFEVLNFGQWQQLWGACLAVNVEGSSVPFSAAASAVLRGYEMKSEQPGSTESPEASSSDG